MTQTTDPNVLVSEFLPRSGVIDVVAVNNIALIANETYTIDFSFQAYQNRMSFIQAVYVDASQCPRSMIMANGSTQQQVRIPPGSVAWYPFLVRDNLRFSLRAPVSCEVNIAATSAPVWTTPVSLAGEVPRARIGAFSSVSASVTSVSLLPENPSRVGATIYNQGTGSLYLAVANTGTGITYSVVLIPGAYYELPFNYTGLINGFWDMPGGSAYIVEYT